MPTFDLADGGPVTLDEVLALTLGARRADVILTPEQHAGLYRQLQHRVSQRTSTASGTGTFSNVTFRIKAGV